MPFLDKLKNRFANGAGNFIESVGGVVDEFTLSKEEKAQFNEKLVQLTNAHTEKMAELAIEESKLEIEAEAARLADVADSRKMNTSIQESDKASWLSKNVAYILDLFLATLWGVVTIIIILKAFKVVGLNVDLTVLLSIHGTVSAIFMVSLQFHRGSSVGSERKQKQLDKMNKS